MPLALLLAGLLASGLISPLIGSHPVRLGHVALYPTDLGCLAAVAVLAFRQQLRIPKGVRLLLALLVAHTVWGLASAPAQTALNGARGWWWLVIALIVAASSLHFTRVFVVALIVLEAVAIIGMFRFGFHNANTLRVIDGEFVSVRPLTEEGALLMLLLGVFLWFERWPWPRLKAPSLTVAVVLLVLVQQRTVWVAALAIVPIMYVRWLRRTHARQPEVGYAVAGLGCLVLPVAAWFIIHSASLSASATSQRTLHWRFASWRAIIDLMTPQSWLIGHPSSAPFTRFVLGVETSVQPHNLCLETVFRFGLLGVVALVLLGVAVFHAARLDRTAAGLAITAACGIAGLTYGPTLTVGLMLGVVLSLGLSDQADRLQNGDHIVNGVRGAGRE